MRVLLLVGATLAVGIAAGSGSAYLRVYRTATDTETMLAGAGSPSHALQPGEPRPRVVVDSVDFDFGIMDDDATRKHVFLLRNEGDDTLILTKGSTTCRCTVVDLDETTIPPGKAAPVTVEWNTKNQGGPYRQSATVMTNDPERPRVTLTITGRVTAAIKVSPPDLVFNSVAVGDSSTGEVRILSYLSDSFQISGHEAEDVGTSDKFEVVCQPLASDELKDEPGAKSGQLVRITAKPGLPLGAFRQKIVLKTNLKENPRVEVPVEGRIVSDISILGRVGWDERSGVLSFGSVSRSEGAERTLLLACRGPHNKGIQYTVAERKPEILACELGKPAEVNEGKLVLTPLTIRVPKGARPVNYLGSGEGPTGQIVVQTNHPQAPELRIVVRFAVQE